MPLRPSFFDDDTTHLLDETRYGQQLDTAVSGIRAPSLLDAAIKSVRRSAYGDENATAWTPLPIVVSDRPDAMQIRQQQQGGTPVAMPSGRDAPPPTPTTPSVPRFSAEDFHFQDGRSEYKPSIQPGESVGDVTVASGPPPAPGSRQAHARAMAQKHGVDGDIFDRQLTQESGYRDDAVSPMGARGPGQFMPATGAAVARQMGVTPEQFWADPELQIEGAAIHMRDLLAHNGGNYRMALAAYNAGQGNVDRYGEGVFGADFANGQTRDYVNIILGGRSTPNAGAAQPSAPAAPSRAPAAAASPPAAAGASDLQGSGPIRVRDQWGNEWSTTQAELNRRPGGNADLTILPSPTMQKASPEDMPLDDGGMSAGDQKRARLAAARGEAWTDPPRPSTASPIVDATTAAGPPPSFLPPSGAPASDPLMLRNPILPPTDPEATTGQEYDPRDADQGAHEAGYTVGGLQPSGGAPTVSDTAMPESQAAPTMAPTGAPSASGPVSQTSSGGATPAYTYQNGGEPLSPDGFTPVPIRATPQNTTVEFQNGGEPTAQGDWREVEMRPHPLADRQKPVWNSQGEVIGYRQDDDTPPSDPTISDSSYTQPPGRRYDPSDPSTGVNPQAPGSLRPTDLPAQMQGARPWLPATAPPGQFPGTESVVDSLVPRSAQTGPDPYQQPQPSRWTPPVAPDLDIPSGHSPGLPGPARRVASPYRPGAANALAGVETSPSDAEIRAGQGTVAAGIEAAGGYLPTQQSESLVSPENRQAFMSGQAHTPQGLYAWHERMTAGGADALAAGLGQDPDRVIASVTIGGQPVRMTVSDLLENVTDPLFGAGIGVGDIVLDAVGTKALQIVAPYLKGAARATINRFVAEGQSLGPLAQRAASGVRGALADNAERVADDGVQMLGSGVVPEGNRRMYHGTASEFGRPDPGKFDGHGLFGPGYYLTSDPRVAGGVGEGRFAAVNPATGSTINPDGTTYTTGDPSRLLRAGYAQQRAIGNLTMEQAYDTVDELLSQALRNRGYYSSGTLDSLMDLHADLSSGRMAKQPGATPSYVIERAKAILSADNPAADATVNEIAGKLAPGANIRAVDVPSGLRLLDIDVPVRTQPGVLDEIEAALGDPAPVGRFREAMRDQATRERTGPMTVLDIYRGLEQAMGGDKALANRVLAAAGYDGITHTGGRRIPMRDKFGDPIEHDVNIVFPESLDKIRNAFSGEAGGSGVIPSSVRGAASNAAQGAFFATGMNEIQAEQEGRDLDPAERARLAITGGVLGAVAGSRAARNAAGRLGSGFVPGSDEAARAARLAREQRITSDYGRKYPDIRGRINEAQHTRPLGEPSAEMLADSRFPRDLVHPDIRADVNAPITEPPNMAGRQNAAVPFDPTGAALGAGAGAAFEGEDGEADPLRTGGAAVVGAVLGRQFPQASRWYQQAAARNARRIAASGKAPLNAREWLMSLAGNVGYSSMLGPGTLSVNLATGIGEPLWSMPKEAARGATRAIRGGGTQALREQGQMHAGAMYGMGRVGEAILDVIKGQGAYAPNPNFPTLSQQTVNPIGQLIAQAVEAPGRVWSGLPDAIFGTIAQHSGEAREAAQIATDAGLKGQAWKAEVARLLQDSRAVGQGQLPTSTDVQRVVDAGAAYAKRQSYRDELGTIGKKVESVAKLGKAPVLGTWASPFFASIWTGGVRQAEKSPIGALMNSQPTTFDRRYDALVGSAVVLGMAEYARRGNVTGSGPSDPKERELLREKGWQPYSTYVKLPGMDGHYVPNRVFGIFEGTLNAAGETHDAFAYQKPAADNRARFDGAMRRTGQLIRQNPYAFQGIVSILDAYNEGPIAAAAGEASRMTPFGASARTAGMMTDTQERTTDRGAGVDPVDEFVQRWQLSTGQRGNLPVAQDAFGQPRANERRGGRALLPNMPREKSAPVADLFREARVMPGNPKPEVRVNDDPALPPVQLRPNERRLWDQKRGDVLLQAGQQIVQNPNWQAAPLEKKQEILRDLMKVAGDAADEQVKASVGSEELKRRVLDAVERKRRAS